jgi:hypothetical protein
VAEIVREGNYYDDGGDHKAAETGENTTHEAIRRQRRKAVNKNDGNSTDNEVGKGNV